MRLSLEKSQEEICTDENGNEFYQARHLSLIEKGKSPVKRKFSALNKKDGTDIRLDYANTGNRFHRNIVYAAGYDIFDKYAQMG